ncbi:DNA repair exonuclease [Thozetella sp. PMI_491]|nr:DNA repair exonuclease [Thozetella sp. PMI_491]
MAASDTDTIRILVATDNHVGFEERDPIRKDDSWRTFDEIMQLAKKEDVDMVLLGGDLFHDNKPSRKSMYQVMRSLRKHCLGMKPCELEFLSDANEVFEGAFSNVNYQDPDINISIPVFSIHGNHDDPSGDGHFCTLDLLQVAGLVNYFGRVPEADNIHVKPILLQKGKTKLALYGLSNVRDERMHRTFRDNKVKFYRPGQQKTDWFNLLTVHQNHYAHTATGYLPENMLPDYMDLVVWGHEHECLVEPVLNHETGFHVMQPGSSVATSLVPGEAVSKHVGILSITGKDFQVEKVPLKTVRPFVTREIQLSSDKRFKGVAKIKDNRQEVTKRLMEIVEEMIDEANEEWLSLQEGREIEEDERPLPLIRLKVEYTGVDGHEYEVENPQRFSNRFAGKVANTNDVVYYYRKKTGITRRSKTTGDASEDVADGLEDADVVKVETLVQKSLIEQALKILPQAPFGDAVTQFVNKDDKHAMETFVIDTLASQVKEMLSLGEEDIDLEEAMAKIKALAEAQFTNGQRKQAQRRRLRPKPDEWDSDLDGHWEDQEGAFEILAPTPAPKGRGRAQPRRVLDDEDEEEDAMEVDEEPEPPARKAPARRGAAATKATTSRATKAAAPKKAAPAKKAPARGKKKTADPFIDSDDEQDDVIVASDEEMEEPAPAPAPRTKRAQPTRASARTKQTTLSFSQSQKPAAKTAGKSSQKPLEISDDEISDDAFESMPSTRTATRRKR